MITEVLRMTEPSAVNIASGHPSEWFGPAVVASIALALDWSAIGSNALRDRVAALGYYAATTSIISIYGWEGAIRGWFAGSWSWTLTGALIAAIMHAGLVLALVGQYSKTTSSIAKRVSKIAHIDHADSSATRINSTLLWTAVLAGMSSVLARGPLGDVVTQISTMITGMWSAIGTALVNGLGG